ncbi:MAG: sigma-54 dependent transcriptional regulator [Proteobacteria bacterium]|nr:sigma-54 dependent transcriptional regulator [Pseudomonadota bacterium]
MTIPLIGASKAILKIAELINNVADTCLNVLITGETGVGKDVVAQNLYAASARAKKKFVKINCAALPETLLESELFGYEKGAFTGAEKKRPGKFKTANHGVLFLDEIGDMPMALQSKMLHVLQSGEFSPLGANKEFKTDVWVIAATNQNLEENIAKKTFREDLFYRLNIINIKIPPLRDRKEDVPFFFQYYCERYNSEYPQCRVDMPDSEMLAKFSNYPWPGNVRQLQNCIKKQLISNSWNKVFEDLPLEHLEIPRATREDRGLNGAPLFAGHESAKNRTRIISQFIDISTSSDKLFEDISLKKIKKLASDRVEKEVITFVLEKVGWNKSQAAKILKVSYKTLLYKMIEFEVQPFMK